MEAHLLTFLFLPPAAVYARVKTWERVFWCFVATNLGQVGSSDKTRTNTRAHGRLGARTGSQVKDKQTGSGGQVRGGEGDMC